MENKNNIFHRIEFILLSATAALFLVFYLFLAFNNRFATDDYEFLQLFRNNGWLGSIVNSYHNHTFRWPAVIIFDLFFGVDLPFHNMHYMIFLYHLVTMLVFIFAVYNLITNVSKLVLQSLPSKKHRITFSLLFIASFYFATVQITDTWYWVIASCVHLQSCIFGILGLSIILKPKKKIIDYSLVILVMAVATGLSENFAIWLILLLTFLIIFIRVKARKQPGKLISLTLLKALFIGLITACISFNINISGSGLKTRMNIIKEETPVTGAALKETVSLPQSFDFSQLPKIIICNKNLAFLLLAASWFFFGRIMKRENLIQMRSSETAIMMKYMKAALPLTIFSIAVVLIPLFYVFKGAGPLRAWTPASLVIAAFFCMFFLITGLQNISGIIENGFRLLLLAGFAIVIAYFIRQANFATSYSKSFDDRCIYFEDLKASGNTKTIDVKGLPDSGMLPNGDITEDEHMHLNEDFRDILKLHFKVKSSDNYFKRYTGHTIVVY